MTAREAARRSPAPLAADLPAAAGSFSAPSLGWKTAGCLLALTFAALLVHGYHPYAEDAEIYVPAIVRLLHPSFYPVNRAFFDTNGHLTLFPQLVAWSVRLSRLPLAWVLFLGHLASIYLLLLAGWKIASKCFPTASGRWGAVGLLAALLTIPIAETNLYILDQYLNPRSLAAFGVLLAVDAVLGKKFLRAALWLVFTALVHPFMAVFGVCYIALLLLAGRTPPLWQALLPALLFPSLFVPHASPAYVRCFQDHQFLSLLRWDWYGWLGALAPVVIMVWFARLARRRHRTLLDQLSRATAVFCLLFFVAAVVIAIPPSLMTLGLYQPLRSLFIVYVLLFLFLGGFLGESVLKAKPLRWLLLFVPVCAGMAYAQFALFPASQHVEWPGVFPKNPWEQAFLWIRSNTPPNAVFALDPRFLAIPGEDHQGFRAIAERSRLADALKDWSDASMYPGLPLADECLAQVKAAEGWKHFQLADFTRLERTEGVSWVVLRQPGVPGLACPYRNAAVLVCQVPH